MVNFFILMKWVTFKQRPLKEEQLLLALELLLPNFFAWCCSDVTLVSLQCSGIGGEETNCFKDEGKH